MRKTFHDLGATCRPVDFKIKSISNFNSVNANAGGYAALSRSSLTVRLKVTQNFRCFSNSSLWEAQASEAQLPEVTKNFPWDSLD